MNMYPFTINTQSLLEQLQTDQFMLDGTLAMLSLNHPHRVPEIPVKQHQGFVPVLEQSMTYQSENRLMMELKVSKRNVPAKVVQTELERRTDPAMTEEEVKRLAAGLPDELLHRAFPSDSYHLIMLDMQRNLLWVEAGSSKVAEFITEQLRTVTGSLEVTPLFAAPPFAGWVQEEIHCPFIIGHDATFQIDKEKVVMSNADIEYHHDIKYYIDHGYEITKLGLDAQGVTFQMYDDCSLHTIKGMTDGDDIVADLDSIGFTLANISESMDWHG